MTSPHDDHDEDIEDEQRRVSLDGLVEDDNFRDEIIHHVVDDVDVGESKDSAAAVYVDDVFPTRIICKQPSQDFYGDEEDGDEESSSPSKIPCLSDGISGEDEKRLKDLFSKLDRNDNGQICIEDLAKSFRELRYM